MKQKSYFYVLVLLTLSFIAHGLLTATPWSIITAMCMGYLAIVEKVGGRLRAPYAKKKDSFFGSAQHQIVYIKALKHCMHRIEHDRSNGAHLAPIDSDWYRRYVRDKWTYALVFHRYQEAQNQYGWEYL